MKAWFDRYGLPEHDSETPGLSVQRFRRAGDVGTRCMEEMMSPSGAATRLLRAGSPT
jgi:hypothetical protein